MTNSGLLIMNEDQSGRHATYDSRKKKLVLAPDTKPPLFDLIPINGGTKFILSAGASAEETILTIKHGLPFKPKVLTYYRKTKAPEAFSAGIAQYSINQALMVFNAFGFGEEYLYTDSDPINMYIKHRAVNTSATSQTFYGSDFEYMLRYMIFNIPSTLVPGYINQQ